MTRGVIPGLLLALLVALGLRCPELGHRPMHNDEAVNAIKFRSLWETGAYRYDPNEHHGPSLFYSTLVWDWLTRAGDFAHCSEARLRAVTVCYGVGLILLLPLVADGLGRGATVGAGLLTAISPAMVYYSRDYIHEMPLVFFTFLALGCGWRYFRSRRLTWALLAGAAVGLMQVTKETFVFPLAAAAGALLLNAAWRRWVEAGDGQPHVAVNKGHVLAMAGAWLLVVVVLFSSFFTNLAGPLDAVRTYVPWTHRALQVSPHDHPWYFYFSRLAFFHVRPGPVWSEGLILVLALAGGFVALTRNGPPGSHAGLLRFLAFYTVLQAAIYSSIPYKTPWCLLGFWHGAVLLAGVGAVALFQRARTRAGRGLVAVLLVAASAQLGAQAWRAAVPYSADRRNPYVYAQTSPDVEELAAEIDRLAAADPAGRSLLIKVIAPGNDYWPLPWYLRGFDRVGWWSEVPADPWAPVMIVSTRCHPAFDPNGSHEMVRIFALRPDAFMELYVGTNLWHARMEQTNHVAAGTSP